MPSAPAADIGKESSPEGGDQFSLLRDEIAVPVVVDVDRAADSAIEQSVTKPADQSQTHPGRLRRHESRDHPLNLLGNF